jgi:hypothetical protein
MTCDPRKEGFCSVTLYRLYIFICIKNRPAFGFILKKLKSPYFARSKVTCLKTLSTLANSLRNVHRITLYGLYAAKQRKQRRKSGKYVIVIVF